MQQFIHSLQWLISNKVLRTKLLCTLWFLALYRLLVFIPVPFVDVTALVTNTLISDTGLEYFAMLLGGTIEQFSIIAVGLIPFINASIIMQLLGSVVPALEELQEQWEQGQQKIQQYTRRLSFPLAFLQSIGMVFFMNFLLGGNVIATDVVTIASAAFVMTVGSMLLIWIGELITEHGLSNGTSLIIFASIVTGIASQTYNYLQAGSANLWGTILFMFAIIWVLMLLTIVLVKTRKDIPVVYARQAWNQETSSLPIPMNPVGMIPIIFAIAFVTFPYLLSQIIIKMGTMNPSIQSMATWIETNFNIYTQQPALPVIIVFFVLIILFTFFYAMITFNPEKMADTIQKRGGFVPGIRPGDETAKYFNKILMHLCFWGGMGLALVGVYTYILNYIPFVNQATQALWSIPVIVQGAGIIIIVGVVQELINKIQSELLMDKYSSL